MSAQQRKVYDVVLAAQLAGLAAVRDGARGREDVDAAARAVVAAAGHGDRFGHGTGHGVGLEIHEAPALGRLRGDRLATGMLCTVEPGIYLEGRFGVRIEDTVAVTADAGLPLTSFPKELGRHRLGRSTPPGLSCIMGSHRAGERSQPGASSSVPTRRE